MIGLMILLTALALAIIGLVILTITLVFDPAKKIKALQTAYFVIFAIAGLLAIVGIISSIEAIENERDKSYIDYDNNSPWGNNTQK